MPSHYLYVKVGDSLIYLQYYLQYIVRILHVLESLELFPFPQYYLNSCMTADSTVEPQSFKQFNVEVGLSAKYYWRDAVLYCER